MAHKNSKKTKRELEPERIEYIGRVKTALNNAFEEAKEKYGLSKTGLRKKLEETYGLRISQQTLDNLFRHSSKSMDFACLMTVCRFFGFDLNKVLNLEPIEGKKEEYKYRTCADSELRAVDCPDLEGIGSEACADIPFSRSVDSVKDKFLLLNDPDYEGTFYGYTAPSENSKKSPNIFELRIERNKDTGVIEAELTTERAYEDSNVKGKNRYVYRGIPVFVKRYLAVVLFLLNEDNSGDFLQIAFSYEEYTNDLGLIFRHGILLTGESINGASLSTQSILLFNKKVPANKNKYLFGLLKAPNHNFSIPVDEAEKIAKKDKDVAEFLEKFKGVLDRNKKEVYMLNEDNILHDRASDMEKYDVVKALLLLKKHSKLASTYHYRARYRYTGFAVKYLAEAKLEVDDENEDDI